MSENSPAQDLSNPMVCDCPASYYVSDSGTFMLLVYEDGSIYLTNQENKTSSLIPMRHVRDLGKLLSDYLTHLDEVDEDDIPF